MSLQMSAARPAPLLCDRILGDVSSMPIEGRLGKRQETLSLAWMDCTRRAFRKRTTSGREIALLLPLGVTLSHDDILWEDADSYVVVEVRPCDLWLVTL